MCDHDRNSTISASPGEVSPGLVAGAPMVLMADDQQCGQDTVLVPLGTGPQGGQMMPGAPGCPGPGAGGLWEAQENGW